MATKGAVVWDKSQVLYTLTLLSTWINSFISSIHNSHRLLFLKRMLNATGDQTNENDRRKGECSEAMPDSSAQ